MKTKKEHIKALRNTQKGIANELSRVYKEAHIPVYLLRIWGERIKSAANFMQKEMKK